MIDDFKTFFPAKMKTTDEMGGMISLAHAQKLVLVSATFSSYHKDFMFQVLGVQYQSQFQFKSTA